jgi:four helix bundle protein
VEEEREMGKTLEEPRIYQVAEALCDEIWEHVIQWERFPRDTVGRQLVESADSIGANIAEGYGRYHFREDLTFLYYARGSTKETGHWIRRAERRDLIPPETCTKFMDRLRSLEPQLNAYINSIRRKAGEPRSR